MEWVLMTLGVCVVIVTAVWLLRRRSGEGRGRPEGPMHTGARSSKGVEDSMSMRMPMGGNSGS